MFKGVISTLLCISFAVMMIVCPAASLSATAEAIKLWGLTVVPSLLPFFICSNIMLRIGVLVRIADAFEPVIRKLFKISGYCAFPFIMSMASGYPVGVKILADMRNEERISIDEGNRAMTFCSTSGPLFMIGAVGAGMFGNSAAGWIIALSHYAGAVFNGILYARLFNKKYNTERRQKCITGPTQHKIYNSIVAASIMDSVNTLFLIGGYMIIFMMVIYFGKMIFSNFPIWAAGIIELSVGCNEVAKYAYYTLTDKVVFASIIISIGGLCVLFQSICFLEKGNLNLKLFAVSKLTHGFFAGAVSYILCKMFLNDKNGIASVFSESFQNTPDVLSKAGFLYNLLFSSGMICCMIIIIALILISYWLIDFINKEDKKSKDDVNIEIKNVK